MKLLYLLLHSRCVFHNRIHRICWKLEFRCEIADWINQPVYYYIIILDSCMSFEIICIRVIYCSNKQRCRKKKQLRWAQWFMKNGNNCKFSKNIPTFSPKSTFSIESDMQKNSLNKFCKHFLLNERIFCWFTLKCGRNDVPATGKMDSIRLEEIQNTDFL